MKHHADLLDVNFWQGHKDRILAGHVHDVFPYDVAKRFKNQRRLRGTAEHERPQREGAQRLHAVISTSVSASVGRCRRAKRFSRS